MSQIKITLETL